MSTHLPTPIPLGGTHIASPPAFETWTATGSPRSNRLDQRDYTRREIACDLWLIEVDSESTMRCKINNVSDAGIHASAPIGFGLAVGQRFEARLANTSAGALLRSQQISKSLGYGTVVRTEMHVHGEDDDRVNFALRFDVPQLLPV